MKNPVLGFSLKSYVYGGIDCHINLTKVLNKLVHATLGFELSTELPTMRSAPMRNGDDLNW